MLKLRRERVITGSPFDICCVDVFNIPAGNYLTKNLIHWIDAYVKIINKLATPDLKKSFSLLNEEMRWTILESWNRLGLF